MLKENELKRKCFNKIILKGFYPGGLLFKTKNYSPENRK